MKIYIASPLFTPEQIKNIQFIEDELDKMSIHYFSPRLGKASKQFSALMGTHSDLNDKVYFAQQVFNENVTELNDTGLVIACVDDKDTGVSWESGYAYAKHTPIITCTFHNFGLNIMLQFCSICHCRSESKLSTIIELMGKYCIDEVISMSRAMSDPFTDDLE